MIQPRHRVQHEILERLRQSPDGLRYASMRPDGIENDLFNYHLKYLVQGGLAVKVADRYRLTTAGKEQLIEQNPIDHAGSSHRFKIASLCLVLQDGRLLYQRRTRQPFLGEQGMIGGGLYRGELATDAASRRLTEEAGLTASFRLIGMLRKRHRDPEGHLYSDIIFHVCATAAASGRLVERNEFGEHEWLTIPEAIAVENSASYGSAQYGELLGRLATTPVDQIPMFYLHEDYYHDIF
jgi:ADP-ribose pyrophosphatase YjhB (NUDIX family)